MNDNNLRIGDKFKCITYSRTYFTFGKIYTILSMCDDSIFIEDDTNIVCKLHRELIDLHYFFKDFKLVYSLKDKIEYFKELIS